MQVMRSYLRAIENCQDTAKPLNRQLEWKITIRSYIEIGVQLKIVSDKRQEQ